ncbi:precorrin-6A synthase (deacetylating) [Pseudonocardia eucalypti]|uniref:Precorrin-6A synthase (Deacetylating) n=1 Tax=Pseudonocardia eucalypti TaxID=648755 RepID=A0ABP9QG16_9PSEU|nr:precorrin-6A synthase [Pseudonocardia eucalypti]
MTRTLLAIGIGVGDPDYVTIQAVEALNAVDVFFVFDKSETTGDLGPARRAICDRHIRGGDYRVVEVPDPPRDRAARDYRGAVRDWRDERTRVMERAIAEELADGECGGFLVWGDPALYDGTIRIIESLVERSTLDLDYQVIPGISSVSALAARHRVTLNRVAGPVLITPGRRLARGMPEEVHDVVVMLDSDLACAALRDQDITIYWGAYLGTEDEVLIAGPLDKVIDEIADTRRALRERHGWVMDSYLLRRAVTE